MMKVEGGGGGGGGGFSPSDTETIISREKVKTAKDKKGGCRIVCTDLSFLLLQTLSHIGGRTLRAGVTTGGVPLASVSTVT